MENLTGKSFGRLKVIELCTQKFNTPQEIQQCKAVLMKIER